jgi:hypothetical protein
MQSLNWDHLISLVKKNTRRNYHTYVSNNKEIPNVANLGGKVGDVFKLERNGEYYGISVELLENLRPILTQNLVLRILKMLRDENYTSVLSILDLHSLDELYYVLHHWFQNAVEEYDNSFRIYKHKYTNLNKWISSVTHDPLLGKIRVADIGYNSKTDTSVLPEDWIGREFSNAEALHEEMNHLEWRLNKPPVTYAVIYSMILQSKDGLIDITKVKYKTIFYLIWEDNSFYVNQTRTLKKDYSHVLYGKTAIGFKIHEILVKKKSVKCDHSVGVLVSRLQKCIRRGRYGSKVLMETIQQINDSPNYNLPEQGFLRVSSCRQLVWRLFISILEDCRPYQEIEEPSLLVLLLLTLITSKLTEYSFRENILHAIQKVALLAQYNDEPEDAYPWRTLKEAKKTPLTHSNFHNAISLALSHVTMMHGDRKMLSKYYSAEDVFLPFREPSKFLHDEKIYQEIILSSYDMHCKPHIILYYQACIPISLTTKKISQLIWDVSSKYNVRYSKKPQKDSVLESIQEFFDQNESSSSNKGKLKIKRIETINPSRHESRLAFLLLFGQKYYHEKKEMILAGNEEYPLRVKEKNEWIFSHEKKLLNAFPSRTVSTKHLDPPIGYQWTRDYYSIEISKGKPVIDGQIVPFFDASITLQSIIPKTKKSIEESDYDTILSILSGELISFEQIQYFRNHHVKSLVKWIPRKSDMNKINMQLMIGVYTKIFNQFDNLITIGPVNRSGGKTQNSIDYLMEGKFWAVFCLFHYLYPDTIRIHGNLNFRINKNTSGYVHLVKSLQQIIFSPRKIKGKIPFIKTDLWDHQKDSVNRIIYGFSQGIHGFGDASCVGSGKTLTALSISAKLMEIEENIYSGILVLLPCNQLISTWKEEIKKHTKGFKCIVQENSSHIKKIHKNTLIISTVARIRDHPIYHKWLLVIIDECLTVQNKNSLQSESAWKQSLMSKHLLMMSATFFRTRFDKLYYMLKMLQTGLPERKEYLETILLESIVSQISNNTRKWISKYHYFELDEKTREKYDQINSLDISTEIKFAKLTSLLTSSSKTNRYLVKQLKELIKKREKQHHRCLLYARAMEEAQFWSSNLNIPIYPQKGKHCIVTYHDGTYGLNDLIYYDTIVMRPPTPDTLPQIKGRLDRHGQKNTELYIDYFVLRDTIEMGLIIRLEIASQFVNKYIMPLSNFYDISVNHSKYSFPSIDSC